jgi:hypothetical protein
MKWFECIEDLCDGSTSILRFRDLKTANAWLEEKKFEEGDYVRWEYYPLGPLEEVDMDSPYFWNQAED